jgi:ribosomal protein S18 acetylase RimI-like enzyme
LFALAVAVSVYAGGIKNSVIASVDSAVAVNLYRSFGFTETGEADDDGEITMILEIK